MTVESSWSQAFSRPRRHSCRCFHAPLRVSDLLWGRIPSCYEKAVLCQAENSSFLTSRNSVPGIPPISVCLGLAGGVVKGAPVLGGEANP